MIVGGGSCGGGGCCCYSYLVVSSLSDNFPVFRDIKPVLFVSELEKGRKSAEFLLKRAPHILPFNVVSCLLCEVM